MIGPHWSAVALHRGGHSLPVEGGYAVSPRLMRDLRAISALNVALHNSATFTPNKVYCVRSRHKRYRLLDEQSWAAQGCDSWEWLFAELNGLCCQCYYRVSSPPHDGSDVLCADSTYLIEWPLAPWPRPQPLITWPCEKSGPVSSHYSCLSVPTSVCLILPL